MSNETITIRIQDHDGSKHWFKVKPGTPFSKIIRAFGIKVRRDPTELRLHFDGKPVLGRHTRVELEMEDDDLIENYVPRKFECQPDIPFADRVEEGGGGDPFVQIDANNALYKSVVADCLVSVAAHHAISPSPVAVTIAEALGLAYANLEAATEAYKAAETAYVFALGSHRDKHIDHACDRASEAEQAYKSALTDFCAAAESFICHFPPECDPFVTAFSALAMTA